MFVVASLIFEFQVAFYPKLVLLLNCDPIKVSKNTVIIATLFSKSNLTRQEFIITVIREKRTWLLKIVALFSFV